MTNSRVASWRDEVDAGVNAGVMVTLEVSFDLELLLEEVGELLINVLNDGLAAVLFVDLIPIASCAHHHQTQVHIALLQLCQGVGLGD